MDTAHGKRFNFRANVIEVFSFLESDFQFVVRSPDDYTVVYASKDIDVTFSVEPPQTVDVEFRRSIFDISLDTILHVRSPAESHLGSMEARTEEILVKGLHIMAVLMKRHATDILRGDKKSFMSVLKVEDRIADEYTLDCRFGYIREQANLAWQQKSYERAQGLYESMIEGLRPFETRRLNYLRRKTQ